MRLYTLLLFCILNPFISSAERDTAARIHTDFPFIDEDDKLEADIFTRGITGRNKKLNYRCYKYDAKGDSILICRKDKTNLFFENDLNKTIVRFTVSDGPAWYLPVFYNILKKTGAVPPGSYKIFIDIKSDTGTACSQVLFHEVDSSLSVTSPLRKELNHTLIPESKMNLAGADLSDPARKINGLAKHTARKVDRAAGKIDRLFKSKGLTSVTEKRDNKEYILLYYEDWFIGNYEIDLGQDLNSQVAKQRDRLTAPVASLATTELESYRSLFSQVKDLTRQKKEKRELQGEIGLTGNWANGQEAYAQQDNNYYELRGRVETAIQDIPVGIEGYYTTQDKNRQIKASYIRIHYDAEQAKNELLQLMNGFKNQFSQTLSKGKGLEQVYGSYLESLKGQSSQLQSELKKETGLPEINTSLPDTAAFRRQILASLQKKMTDTAAADSNHHDAASRLQLARDRAAHIADSANRVYQQALKRYQQIVALEQQGQKYYKLLSQYRNTSYFDSALGYDKLKGLDKADDMTYKQLAKSAAELLPAGKMKRMATGLTSLDLGIFPKDVSKYTMAGQQMKGMDVGYDLNFCEVGATYGSAEFAGRDGTLDKYTTYSGRAIFKPVRDQKMTLVYYGYQPSRKALDKDTFFKNVDIALPAFTAPVHIISAAYEGTIRKNIHLEGEIASSFRTGGGLHIRDQLNSDGLAWHINAEGMIPKTSINVTAGYEHGGKDFQNSTLPVNLSGTDLLKIAAKGDFFKSFLTLGAEYNNIQQHSFYGTGNSSRWGFEVSTHSKRYPSLSLSYKPYTTFRSYTDTLAVPQRPLVGSVWTGKGSYQIKQTGGRSWRFSAVYNKSISEIDTSSYGSNLLQLICNYTTKTWMVTGSLGSTDQTAAGSPVAANPGHMRTTFGMLSGSYPFSKQTTVSGGFDLGFAAFGLSKYGLNAALAYRLKTTPVSVRIMARASEYQLTREEGWKEIYGGSLDVLWQFKTKLKKN